MKNQENVADFYLQVDETGLPPVKSVRWWKETGVREYVLKEGILADFYITDCAKRRAVVDMTMWPILTQEVADQLAIWLGDKRVLEVGAGTGYLAEHLRRRGVRHYRAMDDLSTAHYTGRHPVYGDVERYDALLADFSRYEVVIMSWPPYGHDFARRVAGKMLPGQYLVYQGEVHGCTAGADFDDYLYLNFDEQAAPFTLDLLHVTYPGFRDQWRLYRKTGECDYPRLLKCGLTLRSVVGRHG